MALKNPEIHDTSGHSQPSVYAIDQIRVGPQKFTIII